MDGRFWLQRDWCSSIKISIISIALPAGLLGGFGDLGCLESANAAAIAPAFPDVSVLISGPPIKDPGALLRYGLPINNKNVRQASRVLKQGRIIIVGGLAKLKVDDGIALLNKLEMGMDEMLKIVEGKNRDGVAPKQKELLNYVGGKNPMLQITVDQLKELQYWQL